MDFFKVLIFSLYVFSWWATPFYCWPKFFEWLVGGEEKIEMLYPPIRWLVFALSIFLWIVMAVGIPYLRGGLISDY